MFLFYFFYFFFYLKIGHNLGKSCVKQVQQWHPTLKSVQRPEWFQEKASAAILSYNFAVDQYNPYISPSLRPTPTPGQSQTPINFEKIPTRYSYNLLDETLLSNINS